MKKATYSTISNFAFKLFEKMSLKYGGETTINELRVINAAYGYHLSGEPYYQSTIVGLLGIPKSTVSRSVFNLVKKGWLIDFPDEDDRRRRRMGLGKRALARIDYDMEELINAWSDAMETE